MFKVSCFYQKVHNFFAMPPHYNRFNLQQSAWFLDGRTSTCDYRNLTIYYVLRMWIDLCMASYVYVVAQL